MRSHMAAQRGSELHVAAAGVLCAIDEAAALCAERQSPADGRAAPAAELVTQALFESWDAELPSGLLQLLRELGADPAGGARAVAAPAPEALHARLVELRLWYAQVYEAVGVPVT